MQKFTLSLFSFLFFTSSFAQEIVPLSVGTVMPLQDKTLLSVDGKSVEAKSLMGSKGLIFVFTSNSCPFVVGSDRFVGWESSYNPIHAMASKLGFNLVLINSNENHRGKSEGLEHMKARAAEKGYTAPYYLDRNHELADAFGAKTTPHVFFFNTEFKLVYTGSIDNQMEQGKKKTIPYLEMAMNAVSKGKKVKKSSTTPIGCSIKRTSK